MNGLVRRRADLIRLAVASAVFAIGAGVAHGRPPGRWERDLFRFVNGWADGFRIPFETVMRLGTFASVVAVIVVALLTRRVSLALAAFLAGLGGSVGAHFMRQAVGRGRPLDLVHDVVVRGPRITGLGYPSGHTTTAAALVAVTVPYLPRRIRPVAWIAVGGVAVARVYVGAHLPLDVVGGAAFGLAIGSIVNFALGTPVA